MAKAHLIRALQIAAAVVVVALAIGLYRAKSDAAKTEAHVRELQEEIADREAAMRELRAEIAERESPANVEAMAEQRLGAVVGSESAALPEQAIDDRLPAPRAQKARE
jgi:cell division protein FtsL